MGTTVIGHVHGGRFHPSDPGQAALMDELAGQDEVKAVFTRPRNVAQHRLLFALLRVVADNSPSFDDTGKALTALKIATGHVDVAILPTGETMWLPKSISFASMGGADFSAWLPRALDVICTRLLPGTAPADVVQEVWSMTGIRVDIAQSVVPATRDEVAA